MDVRSLSVPVNMIYFFFLFAVFVFCCCSFHFNYALVALVIMRIIPILELLALFWLWLSGIVWPVGGSSRCGSCCYFFSGFGISFAFDYVFGIIQVLSLGPTLLPLPLSLSTLSSCGCT